MHTFSRRSFIIGLGATAMTAASFKPALAESLPVVEVEKTASCGCCVAWIRHLEDNGFQVSARNVSYGAMVRTKISMGLKQEQFSCHTARVGGYVVEGHVPAADIRRLLAEKPDATGLSVPEMPMGSPGMDFGTQRDPYDVLLVRRDGSAEVYSSYNK